MTTPDPRLQVITDAYACDVHGATCPDPLCRAMTAIIAREVADIARNRRYVPLAAPGDVVLRGCARCAGLFNGYPTANNMPFWCPPCRSRRCAGFDPQPNDVVNIADQPGKPYVVLTRDGDLLTIRRLGFPDYPSDAIRLAGVMPQTTGAY